MAGFQVTVRGETHEVEVFPQEGNARRFSIGTIPLSGTVSRAGSPVSSEIRYTVSADVPVCVPDQALYTPDEYHSALNDAQMPSHVNFAVAMWAMQRSEAAQS